MGSTEQNPSLGEAANQFLADLSSGERATVQPEIYKFIRWFGRERPFNGLTGSEVANYAERLSLSDTDYQKKLDLVKNFLTEAKKKGWSKTNLSPHLRTRKGKTRPQPSSRQAPSEKVFLTKQGYAEMEAELESLRGKRMELIEEIRKAAADKDFRENVPLQAAREQRGHVEGRIMELEETLKSAAIIDKKEGVALRVSVGDSVIISDLNSGEELRYMLVGPNEVDPTKGKISSASPIGRALIGKGPGEIVKVAVPVGTLSYQIKQVER